MVALNGMIGLLCAIWGFNWVIMKMANSVFPPVLFAGYRFGVGAAILLAVCLLRKIPLPSAKDLKWYIVCGLLQTTYFNIAIQLSLDHISAGLTSVLTYSMPLWLSLMAHFMIPEERLTGRKLLGVCAGSIGMFFAMDAHVNGSMGALFLALSSGIAWALSNFIIKRKLAHCDNLQFTTWQMVTGAAGLFVYSICLEHGTVQWGLMPVVYIGFAGAIGSSLAFIMWFRILSNAEASKASISLLLVPVIGVLSGWIVLQESLKTTTLIGIVFVLIGIFLVNSVRNARKPVQEHEFHSAK